MEVKSTTKRGRPNKYETEEKRKEANRLSSLKHIRRKRYVLAAMFLRRLKFLSLQNIKSH
jgi:hypothetical protein